MDERRKTGPDVFRAIAEKLAANQAVAFIGAGFSLNAKRGLGSTTILDWDGLAKEIALSLGYGPDQYNAENAPALLEEYKDKRGPLERKQRILDGIPDRWLDPGSLHERLLQLPWQELLTTNIDTLLERTPIPGEPKARKVFKADHLSLRGLGKRVFKLHGDIEEPDSWIFSASEYEAAKTKLESSDAFWSTVISILASFSVVFFGYSLRDPDLELILTSLQRQQNGNRPRSYLFTKEIEEQRREDLRKLNVLVITPESVGYGPSEEIPAIGDHRQSRVSVSDADFLEFVLSEISKGLEELQDTATKNEFESPTLSAVQRIERLDPEAYRIAREPLGLPQSKRDSDSGSTDIESRILAILQLSEQSRSDANLRNDRPAVDAVLLGFDNVVGKSGELILNLVQSGCQTIRSGEMKSSVMTDFLTFIIDGQSARIDVGLWIPLDAKALKELRAEIKRLLRSKKIFAPQRAILENQALEIGILSLVNGTGIPESNLYRALHRFLPRMEVGGRFTPHLKFRLAVAAIYENEWTTVGRLLTEALSQPGWKKLWSAILHLELGEPSEALQRYGKILLDPEATELEKAFAARSWKLLFGSRAEGASKLKHFREIQEKAMQVNHRASSTGGTLDLMKDQFKELNQSLQKQTIDGLQSYIDDQEYQSLRFRTGDPFGRLNRLIFAHYFSGTPLASLRTRQMRQMIRAIIKPPSGLDALLEFNGVLPVFEEFEKEKILERASFVALRDPKFWHKLQRRIITQVLNLMKFLRDRKAQRNGPLEGRLISLFSLLSKISPLLSRSSLDRLRSEIAATLPTLRQEPFMTAHGLIPAMATVLAVIAKNMDEKEAPVWVVELEAWNYNDRFGGMLLSAITDRLDLNFWGNLTPTQKSQVLSAIRIADPWAMESLIEFYQSERKHGNTEDLRMELQALAERIKKDRLKEIAEKLSSAQTLNLDEANVHRLKEEKEAWKTGTQTEYAEWLRVLSLEGYQGEKKTQPVGVSDWIAAKRAKLKKSFPSSLLSDINQLDLRSLTAEDRSSLEEFLESIAQRLESLREKGRLDYTFKSQVLGPIQVFYLYVEEFDQWLSLWERFDHFEYDFRPLFPYDEKNDGGFTCPSEFFNELAFRLPSLSQSNDRMRLLTALDFLSRYLLALDERILPAVRVLLHNHEVLSHAGFLPMELVLQILKNTPTSGEFLERLTLNLLKTMAGKRNLIAIPRTVIAYRALYNHLASQGLVADSDPVLQPFLETLENLDLPLQPND